MDKLTQDQLREALELNYWSVDIALSYLVEIELTDVEKHYFRTGRVLIDKAQGNVDNYTQQVKYHNEEVIKKIASRHRKLKKLWHDTDHDIEPRIKSCHPSDGDTEFAVEYFVVWALRKGIEIPWLSWAINEGLLPKGMSISQTTEPQSSKLEAQDTPSEKSKTTYLHIIGALLATVKGETIDFEKSASYESEAHLIRILIKHYNGYQGMSKRNLETKFKEAKLLIENL